MKKSTLTILVLLAGLLLWPQGALAHCDAADGPVATAALKALDTKNVNLVLPYAPAVRLHRAGEKAPYTGLKPAGTDFGPAIPAADKAVETGSLDPLLKLMSQEVNHGIAARFEHVLHTRGAPKEPKTKAEVQAVRERVSAELGFTVYIEGIYLATKGAAHSE